MKDLPTKQKGDKTMNEEKVIETETKAVNKLVSGFKYEITNQETYNQGGEWLKLIKAKAKDLDTLRFRSSSLRAISCRRASSSMRLRSDSCW